MNLLTLNEFWLTATQPWYHNFQQLRHYRRIIMRIKSFEPLPPQLFDKIITEFIPLITPPPSLIIHTSFTDLKEFFEKFEEQYYQTIFERE